MLDTLPEWLTLARQQKMPHHDLLLQVRTDLLLKTLKHARLDNSYEAELRKGDVGWLENSCAG